MYRRWRIPLLLLTWLCCWQGLAARDLSPAPSSGLDSVPRESLVFVEAFDSADASISVSVGVIVKKGYVALNYHYLMGAAKVSVFKATDPKRYAANGYLSVEELLDLIVISVPELDGKPAVLSDFDFPKDGATVQLTASAEQRRMDFANGTVRGLKDIGGKVMSQVLSGQMEDCTGGPIFQSGRVVGFTLAGYGDENFYYAYGIPAFEVKRLLNRSFIIKTFTAFADAKPARYSPYQAILMESLEAVLWKSLPEAERIARTREKMVIIDLRTKWAGWVNLMDRNTWSKKSIIRYINENFSAVRLDAETNDTIVFNRMTYTRNSGSPYHALAYSLLEGNMQFPATVILDQDLNVIYVIPGYLEAKKMEVMLHYFGERAYENNTLSYPEFERQYWERQATLDRN